MIQMQQTDFEAVVSHELIHGLGFTSYWRSYSLNKPILLPNIAVHGSSDTAKLNDQILNWMPMKIYDRFLVATSTGTSLMAYATSIFYAQIQPGTLFANFIAMFEQSGYPYQAAQYVYQLATTSQAISLRPTGDTQSDLRIFTTSSFNQGQSISHVDGALYSNTPDFLMSHNDEGVSFSINASSKEEHWIPLSKQLQTMAKVLLCWFLVRNY